MGYIVTKGGSEMDEGMFPDPEIYDALILLMSGSYTSIVWIVDYKQLGKHLAEEPRYSMWQAVLFPYAAEEQVRIFCEGIQEQYDVHLGMTRI